MTSINLVLLIVSCSFIFLIRAEDDSRIQVEVPSEPLFIGDKAKFICSVPESDFEEHLDWGFVNLDGQTVFPNSSSQDDELSKDNSGHIIRKSYLTVTNANSVSCVGTTKSGEKVLTTRTITVYDVVPVSTFDDRCSNTTEFPKIIMFRFDDSGFESRFWVPHVVTNAKLELGDSVTHFRLGCYYKSEVKWILSGQSQKLKPSKPIRDSSHANCSQDILEVKRISAETPKEYSCGASHVHSTLSLTFSSLPGPSFVKILNDNSTADLAEILVETYHSTNAYGIGFGSSAGSIVLMVGVMFLKKTLQRRREAQQGSSSA